MAPIDLDQFEGYTPGEWERANLISNGSLTITRPGDVHPLAAVRKPLTPAGNANARLIAAAPALLTELREARERITELEAQKDGAYTERNALVCALSKVWPSWLERHPEDDDWDADWMWIVFMDSPAGQLSWHLHDSDLANFAHLDRSAEKTWMKEGGNSWDGHSTEEKYARLASLPPKEI